MSEQSSSSHSQPENGPSQEFQRQAEERPPGLLAEFVDFILHNKKWWLVPIIVVLLLLAGFIVLAGTSLAPFIYPVF